MADTLQNLLITGMKTILETNLPARITAHGGGLPAVNRYLAHEFIRDERGQMPTVWTDTDQAASSTEEGRGAALNGGAGRYAMVQQVMVGVGYEHKDPAAVARYLRAYVDLIRVTVEYDMHPANAAKVLVSSAGSSGYNANRLKFLRATYSKPEFTNSLYYKEATLYFEVNRLVNRGIE